MKSVFGLKMLTVLLGLALVLSVGLLVTAAEASHQSKFELSGTATFAKDPTNSANFVIKVDNTTGFGAVRRVLNTKITALDEHLTVRYYFVSPKDCGVGSPRIQLAVDLNGDGVSEGNAFGHIGPFPTFTGCQQNQWVTEDLTISILEGLQANGRWDAGQLGCGVFVPWDIVKACIAGFVNHLVLRATLVEDPAPFVPSGTTFYDEITLGYRTLEDARDVSGNN